MIEKAADSQPTSPLRNVGWNRDRASLYLSGQPVPFVSRKRFGGCTAFHGEVHGSLPHFKILITADRRFRSRHAKQDRVDSSECPLVPLRGWAGSSHSPVPTTL